MSAVRERLLERLGRLPARRPPSPPSVDRRFVLDGVTFERWRWDGPRDAIHAWFLIGATTPAPAPAVLALHPHGRQFETAKSLVAGLVGDPSRGYGLEAARAGFAVLAPDLPGFEDRRPPLGLRKENYALQGEAYERTLATRALVQGATLQGWILADIASCLDVLESDRRVDAARIGAFGQSFGGQETIFGMLFDARLKAGVSSCGFSLVRLLVERDISHNLALYVPGLLPDLDFDALVPAIAPRSLCVIAGRRDAILPEDGVAIVEARARAAWAAAGAPDGFVILWFDGPHDLRAADRDVALAWLRQALS